MEDWEKEEIQTLCSELEKLGGNFQCCVGYYDYDTQGGYDSYIEFTVTYLGDEALKVSLKGCSCREIYEDKDTLIKLHIKILERLKLFKMYRDKKELEKDFEKGVKTNGDI